MPRGRVSIFGSKVNGVRLQGLVSKIGGQAFERARLELSDQYRRIVGHEPPPISDADTFEALARGSVATTQCLRKLKERAS